MMICVPIKTGNKNSMLASLKQAESIGDLSELWLDEISDIDSTFLEKIFRTKKKPVIYKCSGIAEIFNRILSFAPEYIDLDINSPDKMIRQIEKLSPRTKIILSFHDFKKTPKTMYLKKIIEKMRSKGADIFKIAVYAENFKDSLGIMNLLSLLKKRNKKIICFCMGKEGKITRKTGHLLGNYIMYAPVKADQKTAPGQINAAQLRKIQQLCHSK